MSNLKATVEENDIFVIANTIELVPDTNRAVQLRTLTLRRTKAVGD